MHVPGEQGGDRLAAENGLEFRPGAEQPLVEDRVVQLERRVMEGHEQQTVDRFREYAVEPRE